LGASAGHVWGCGNDMADELRETEIAVPGVFTGNGFEFEGLSSNGLDGLNTWNECPWKA